MKLPIRIRLTAAFCIAFFAMIAVVEVGAWFIVRSAIHSIVERELHTRLSALVDHLERHINVYGWPKLGESLKAHPGFQPDLLVIRRAGGEVLLHGQSLTGISALDYSPKPQFRTLDNPAHVLRVLAVRRTILGQNYDLTLGTDLLVPTAILRRLWLLMLVSLPLVLVGASAAGYWMSSRALKPVSGIITAARSIDSASLSARIAVPSTGDEIQQLAETMNAMLGRIEDGFRQIRQFTADASHELRTPLAIIRAAAEVALLRSPADRHLYEDALERILLEAERNSTLLEDMLHLARTDAGSDSFRKERLDLARLLAQVSGQATPLAESKGLRVTLEASGPLWIEGDEDQVRRLLLILLDNAVKYTPQGGRIAIQSGEATGRPFCAVSDTGMGIAAEHLPRIFDRFYRVDKARSRRESGSGLGLSIALGIARRHGADIEVQSEPRHGSSFRVLFPPAVPPLASAPDALAPHLFR